MAKTPSLGLRTRIVIALAVTMALFIVLTEASVYRLVRLSMKRQIEVAQTENGAARVQETMEEDLLNLRKLVFFYMAVGAALAIVLGSLAVTRLVVRPLARITRAFEEVAEGKLDTKLPIEGSGELIRLGVTFNRMTATLKEQRVELEHRLRQLERSSADLKEAQDRLIRAAKLASVGTLAAGVAHEIGNPLTGVLGLLDTLDVEKDKEAAARYRELMKKEIRRIDRIINDLLVYSRPARQEPDEPARTTLEEVLEHVRALLEAQQLFDRVEIDADLSGGPWAVMVSRDDLTQVLINLLLNAAQAMEGRGRLTIGTARLEDWRMGLGVVSREAVRLTVSDDGPGISKEHAGRIFDPFYSSRESGQGSGLGLAICQSICERAGGEIALDRDFDGGSRFYITLLSAP